jgi:cytochrome c2
MPTTGKVGPPLNGIAERAYLAGRLPNTAENMLHWIRFPREVDPDTVMPNMGISQSDARDLTAFLYRLQ